MKNVDKHRTYSIYEGYQTSFCLLSFVVIKKKLIYTGG